VEMGFTDFVRKPLTYETMAQLLKKHTGHVMVGAEPVHTGHVMVGAEPIE